MPKSKKKKKGKKKSGFTYGNLPEALVQHGHQQLGQHDHDHDVVGADDQGAHERAQLFGVADAGDEEGDVRQREDVPEEGVAGANEPASSTRHTGGK